MKDRVKLKIELDYFKSDLPRCTVAYEEYNEKGDLIDKTEEEISALSFMNTFPDLSKKLFPKFLLKNPMFDLGV